MKILNLMKKSFFVLIITIFLVSIIITIILYNSANSKMDVSSKMNVSSCSNYCLDKKYEYSECIESSSVKFKYFQNMDKIIEAGKCDDGDEYVKKYLGDCEERDCRCYCSNVKPRKELVLVRTNLPGKDDKNNYNVSKELFNNSIWLAIDSNNDTLLEGWCFSGTEENARISSGESSVGNYMFGGEMVVHLDKIDNKPFIRFGNDKFLFYNECDIAETSINSIDSYSEKSQESVARIP